MLASGLKVFIVTAQKLSFTKAAAELYMTQPAVTKHIHKLEQSLETKLFNRHGNKISLTPAGERLLQYAYRIESLYNQLYFDLSQLKNEQKGSLKIGSSTTITQYVLPGFIQKFSKRYPDIKISVMNGNTEKIEQAVLKNEIDIGLIEGQSKRSGIQYKTFLKDEIVLVGNPKMSLPKQPLDLISLKKYPLVIRESGSGTREVLAYHLQKSGFSLSDFNIIMEYGSTQGIKGYLRQAEALAFLSYQSVKEAVKRRDLCLIATKDFKVERYFNFIYPEGSQNKLVDLVLNFAHYNF